MQYLGRRRTIVPALLQYRKENEKEVQETKQEKPSFKGVKVCPKCGKEMVKGLPMHVKWCKG